MRFEEYLVSLVRPLGVYDLREGTVNRGELASYGVWLDGNEDGLDETAREMNLTTAEGFGLERIEELLLYRPVCETAQQRRDALAALLRIGGDSFTPEAINDTMQGCGLNVVVREGKKLGYVEVYFVNVAGYPDGLERLKLIIEEILPSHVVIDYMFWFNTWGEVAGRHPTWGEAVDTGMTWYELAIENEGIIWPPEE